MSKTMANPALTKEQVGGIEMVIALFLGGFFLCDNLADLSALAFFERSGTLPEAYQFLRSWNAWRLNTPWIGGFYVLLTLLLPAVFYSQVKGMVQIFTRKAGFVRHFLDLLAFITLWFLYLPILIVFKTPLQQRLAVAVCKLGICGELIVDYTKYCQAVCALNLLIVLIYAGRFFTPTVDPPAPRAAEKAVKKD